MLGMVLGPGLHCINTHGFLSVSGIDSQLCVVKISLSEGVKAS